MQVWTFLLASWALSLLPSENLKRDFVINSSETKLSSARHFQEGIGVTLTSVLHFFFQKHIFVFLPNEKKGKRCIFCNFYISVSEYKGAVFASTSVGPDPSRLWSDFSALWWRPAHPSAAAHDPDPPDSIHSLLKNVKAFLIFLSPVETLMDSHLYFCLGKSRRLPGLLRRHLSSYSTSACLSSKFCCFILKEQRQKKWLHKNN